MRHGGRCAGESVHSGLTILTLGTDGFPVGFTKKITTFVPSLQGIHGDEKIRKRRLQASYVTSIISITLVLFMLGLLGLIILHGRKLSDFVRENISITVLLKEDVSDDMVLISVSGLKNRATLNHPGT
jgi:hypothetical protein